MTYTGSELEPIVTVKDRYKSTATTTTTLQEGTDFEVTYSDNVNAGTATVTVEGIGNFTGTAKRTFTINAKSISGVTITPEKDSYTYTGSAITPNITVTDGDMTLAEGTDYTVECSNNTAIGTATVTITGMGNYTGTASTTFSIVKKSIADATAALSYTTKTYTGSALTPTVTVKDGSTTLTKGTDYTVTYSNNTNVGTATVTITGAGDYSGTITETFAITEKAISSVTVTPSYTTTTYTGSALKPTVTVKDGSTTLTSGTDYTVAYSNNTNVGTATITITGKGNYTGTTSTTFAITAKAISSTTITLSSTSMTYTGSALKPTVTVKNGSTTLTSGTDYTVSYSNNTNIGTATVTITGIGNFTGTTTKTFSITCTNHTYDSGTVTKEATCTSAGTKTYTCTKCGDTYTETIAATGHSYTSKVTKAATCTTAGTRTYTCSNCGDTYTTSIAATGHSYTTKTVAATYAAQGYTLHTCSICGNTYKDNYTAKKTVPSTTASTSFTPTASSVKISWTKVSVASGYQVQRYNSSTSSWSTVKTITSGSTTSYTNSSLSGGTTYKYRVRAYVTYNGTNYYGSYSSTITTTTKPSKVTASSSYTKTTSAITIKWTKVSGASGYQVQRYNSSSKSWSTVKTITSGSTVSYKNTGLSSGTTYKYRVRAYTTLNGTKYYGSYSSTITTSTKPAQVTIKSTSKSKTAIKLTWKKVTGASGYEVQRYNSSTKKWVTVKTIKSGSTVSYKNTGLKKGTTYKYRIRAYRTVNGTKLYGAWSSTKKVTTKS